VKAKSAAERENMQSVPDLRNETLNLIDDFILDHIEDFSHEELIWIIEELEQLAKSFYKKFKVMIDEDIEELAEELDDDD
jgi:hypothetical protein